MINLRGFGIGLSLVFGILLVGLVAELYYLLWWKKKRSVVRSEMESKVHEEADLDQLELELGSGKDLLLKAFGEEGVEAELMRLHNLSGPPRFLFTIKEETREDLETDSVRSRTVSLGDLVMPDESPLTSPIKNSPSLYGFNPLFEASASPPPRFKFLRDAEEKLQRRVSENGVLEAKDQELQQQEQRCCSVNVNVVTQKCSSPLHPKTIAH